MKQSFIIPILILNNLQVIVMTSYGGYVGRIGLLDLGTQTLREYPWTDRDRELYIGGKAAASKILFDNLTGKETPFGEDNLIVISTGPVTGTFSPSSNRFDISTLSPLTGITTSSNCGGNLGLYLKYAGWDALIIRGKCERPTWIELRDDTVSFHDASALWGMTVTQAQNELLRLTGLGANACGTAVIGPAGENLVKYASLVSGERIGGRGGVGAVFGSKLLKGIVASGTHKIPIHDPEKAHEHNKKWMNTLRTHPMSGSALPKMGTAGLTSILQLRSILPTRNFSAGQYEKFDLVSGEALAEEFTVKNSGCTSCPIRCSRRVRAESGELVKGPELEIVGLMGGNIGNDDLGLICRWNTELDELGMDAISAAGTIAWAMEAGEKGLWDNGLAFGKTEGISALLDDIAHRRGIGAELAEGSRALSKKYGGEDFAMQSKGMELPSYEPRRAVGHGLGYAVANRGGCHINGGYMVMLEGLGLHVNPTTTHGKADLCVILQHLLEGLSVTGHCIFTSFAVFPAFIFDKPNGFAVRAINAMLPAMGGAVRLINKCPRMLCFNIPLLPHTYELKYTVGMSMNLGKFLQIGERSYNVERALNAKFGVNADCDKLPKRLTEMAQDPNDPSTRVPLEKLKKTYYRARGWGKDGLPDEKKLRRLGIIE